MTRNLQKIKQKAVPVLKSHGAIRAGVFGSAARLVEHSTVKPSIREKVLKGHVLIYTNDANK